MAISLFVGARKKTIGYSTSSARRIGSPHDQAHCPPRHPLPGAVLSPYPALSLHGKGTHTYGRRHRAWRYAVLTRDGGRCQVPGCQAEGTVADHIFLLVKAVLRSMSITVKRFAFTITIKRLGPMVRRLPISGSIRPREWTAS
jgi:hypothetical protein